jgi:hypothetical protein
LWQDIGGEGTHGLATDRGGVAKVHKLHGAVASGHDVPYADVLVHNARCVGGGKGIQRHQRPSPKKIQFTYIYE